MIHRGIAFCCEFFGNAVGLKKIEVFENLVDFKKLEFL
jgi:hypothetical protein